MKQKFYKVKSRAINFTGQMGPIVFVKTLSQWLTENDANSAIASGIAVRCDGAAAPYHQVYTVDAPETAAENLFVGSNWTLPEGGTMVGDDNGSDGSKPVVGRAKVQEEPRTPDTKGSTKKKAEPKGEGKYQKKAQDKPTTRVDS